MTLTTLRSVGDFGGIIQQFQYFRKQGSGEAAALPDSGLSTRNRTPQGLFLWLCSGAVPGEYGGSTP